MGDIPELLVAVDFGMTCTGVAYVNVARGDTVHYIQRWPGRGQANENKVPTVVTYDKRTNQISSWGFSSETRYEQNSPEREYCQWFKTCLDETHYQILRGRDPRACPPSQQHVDRWTEDYLRSLYAWVSTKLEPELPPGKSWDSTHIEFVFSVPTTWEPQPTVDKFKKIALKAGWGSSMSHVLSIGLTEAEAAAVYAACEASVLFSPNDILLVADCGGGTTDLNILRVKAMRGGKIPSLEQLNVVEGKAIGSTQIDLAFEDVVYARLQMANSRIPMRLHDLEGTAWTMMKSSQYLDAKCCFGQPDDLNFRVPIPDLDYRYSNPECGIYEGQMLFQLQELQALFDRQMTGLYALIDAQLRSFAQSHPNDEVRHLVLSGGLGNSVYVQRQLKDRYATNVDTFPNTRHLRVHVCNEPQLAVCKGICHDRIKGAQGGEAVLRWRCCRASYGTDCKILYDPNNPTHHGKITKNDSLDGKDYIMNGVAWFIRKGAPIDVTKPLVQHFTRKITPGDPRRAFSDKVVWSQLDGDFLPLQYGDGAGANVLCRITCDLSAADEGKFKVKNRHWWQSKKKYMRVQYEIRVVIGAADITFELWFDGQRLSRGTPITVEWQAASGPERDSAVHINGYGSNGDYSSPVLGNSRLGSPVYGSPRHEHLGGFGYA